MNELDRQLQKLRDALTCQLTAEALKELDELDPQGKSCPDTVAWAIEDAHEHVCSAQDDALEALEEIERLLSDNQRP